MKTFHLAMTEYRKHMKKGTVLQAYRGLMEYILQLKTHVKNRRPRYSISGALYSGDMDMFFTFKANAYDSELP
ncbi:MAG: hypothetical protein JW929_15155 [Anaerolineales bacterium]|nr:hypothetical protein [Anaerolineales bacterium]